MTPSGREIITSLQNPRIKEAIHLQGRRARKQSGKTRIDGARELLRALEGGIKPQLVYICKELVRPGEGSEALRLCREKDVPLQEVSPQVSEKLAFGDRNEGLCAIVKWQPSQLENLRLSASALILVIVAIEKPGNLGALLRTADAAGVDAVILCDAVTDCSNPNAIRASMGTIFTLPLFQSSSEEAQAYLRSEGVEIFTTRPEASTPYWNADLAGATALVFGAEHEGLGEGWREASSTPLRIPMSGAADSLNVNVAAALVLFEARRQRQSHSYE